MIWETPLRTGNLRDPNGPQVTFASESFIDELAAAAKADPVEFRLRMLNARTAEDDRGSSGHAPSRWLKRPRRRMAGMPRPSPSKVGRGKILTGRGIAYASVTRLWWRRSRKWK